MGRDRARPIKVSEPWAAARPSSSHSQTFTARAICSSNVSAQPDPAHHMAARTLKHGLYMGRPGNCLGRPVDLTGRPMGRPMRYLVLKGARAYSDEILVFVVFSRLDSVEQLLSAHETHNQYPRYIHTTTRSDGFLWATTSS